MSALVVYESVYGNTRAIAEAIAEGLGGADVTAVHEAPERPEGIASWSSAVPRTCTDWPPSAAARWERTR